MIDRFSCVDTSFLLTFALCSASPLIYENPESVVTTIILVTRLHFLCRNTNNPSVGVSLDLL